MKASDIGVKASAMTSIITLTEELTRALLLPIFARTDEPEADEIGR